MKVGMKTRRAFFDSPKVIRAMDRKTRAVFSRFGAYVRTGARSSIRKRRRPAPPGSPPSSHTGLLKRFIFFAYDADKKTVVIGPEPLSGRAYPDALPALEHGGTFTRRGRRRSRKKLHRVNYPARPFMGPAMQQELPKLPSMWAGSIK